MVEALLDLIGSGLKVWELKEKRKYSEQLMELQKAYYEESNKPEDVRSDAVLCNIKFELRNLASGIAAEFREQSL